MRSCDSPVFVSRVVIISEEVPVRDLTEEEQGFEELMGETWSEISTMIGDFDHLDDNIDSDIP